MPVTRVLATFTVLLLAFPAGAIARGHPIVLAPPGNSAVSQYVEVVPTAAGGGVPRNPGGGGTAGGGGLTSAQARSDNRLGQAGRLLVAVVQATAPNSAGGSVGASGEVGPRAGRGDAVGQGSASSSGVHAQLAAAGSSPISSVLAAATGNGQSGLGFVLLGLLLAAGVAVAAGAVLRQRALRRRAPGS